MAPWLMVPGGSSPDLQKAQFKANRPDLTFWVFQFWPFFSQGSLKDTFCNHLEHGFFNTKIQGHHHLQGAMFRRIMHPDPFFRQGLKVISFQLQVLRAEESFLGTSRAKFGSQGTAPHETSESEKTRRISG